MLPLYYRYTQLESNGNKVNDELTYSELGRDRRVSTSFSRPLVNFSYRLSAPSRTGVAASIGVEPVLSKKQIKRRAPQSIPKISQLESARASSFEEIRRKGAR